MSTCYCSVSACPLFLTVHITQFLGGRREQRRPRCHREVSCNGSPPDARWRPPCLLGRGPHPRLSGPRSTWGSAAVCVCVCVVSVVGWGGQRPPQPSSQVSSAVGGVLTKVWVHVFLPADGWLPPLALPQPCLPACHLSQAFPGPRGHPPCVWQRSAPLPLWPELLPELLRSSCGRVACALGVRRGIVMGCPLCISLFGKCQIFNCT